MRRQIAYVQDLEKTRQLVAASASESARQMPIALVLASDVFATACVDGVVFDQVSLAFTFLVLLLFLRRSILLLLLLLPLNEEG